MKELISIKPVSLFDKISSSVGDVIFVLLCFHIAPENPKPCRKRISAIHEDVTVWKLQAYELISFIQITNIWANVCHDLPNNKQLWELDIIGNKKHWDLKTGSNLFQESRNINTDLNIIAHLSLWSSWDSLSSLFLFGLFVPSHSGTWRFNSHYCQLMCYHVMFDPQTIDVILHRDFAGIGAHHSLESLNRSSCYIKDLWDRCFIELIVLSYHLGH